MFFPRISLFTQIAVLCISLMPSFSIQAQPQPVSKAGVAIVSGITLSCLLATSYGAYATYNYYKEWRASAKRFDDSQAVLKKIGAIIHEWQKVTFSGNIKTSESHIKVSCDKRLSNEEKTMYDEHSNLLLKDFKLREENCQNMIGSSAFTTVLAFVSGALVKSILDNTVLAQ